MSELTEMELELNSFIDSVFHNEPMPPFSFRFELSSADPNMLNNFLQSFVLKGCDELFNTELHSLSKRQVGKLREYLLSIGYDVDYDNKEETKLVKIYNSDGSPALKSISSSRFNVTFKSANPALNSYNSHVMNPFNHNLF